MTRLVTDGVAARVPEATSVANALQLSLTGRGRMALFLYPSPTPESITELADAWRLHPVLRENLLTAHQRPKLEQYGDDRFLVVRSARYIDEAEEVAFEEFHMLIRPNAFAMLCQDGRWIDGTDGARFDQGGDNAKFSRQHTLLSDAHLLTLGPEAVAYRVLDEIVDGYAPVLRELVIDKEQIEKQVFGGDTTVTERIYRLSQEVVELQHATASLAEVLSTLQARLSEHPADELRIYLQDVADHLSHVNSGVSELRSALAQILTVNATLVAQRQNHDMQRISGWAAILFAPTLVAAVYGMNFDLMPELHWKFGYPLALIMMISFAGILFGLFKWRKWL